jgi:D-alanyl-D-alanine carboxypeptidase
MAANLAATMDPEKVGERLQGLLDRLASRSRFGHAVMGIERGDGSFRWVGAAGAADDGSPLSPDTPFFIASVTKLYIATLILQLHEQGEIDLDAPIGAYLGADRVAGLHVIGGTDHTPQITVRHLLGHTSGLPDYLEGRPRDGQARYRRIAAGEDMAWDLDEVLRITREELRPHFPPQDLAGDRPKGRYSDTNFQLLIAVVETVTGKEFPGALETHVLRPLDLRNTWVPGRSRPLDASPEPPSLRSKGRPLHIPKAMASSNDLVSTADDTLRFLRSLNGGEVFAYPATVGLMRQGWKRVIWPLIYYGLGTMRFRVGRLNAPGRRPVTLVGHSGSTGSWLFHCPELDLLLTGTVDEAKAHARPFRFLPKVLRAAAG